MGLSWADSYLGQLRALAGDRTLLFIGARSVIRDDDGRILLVKRSDNGQWAFPAGAMELGESIADCAIREVWEESGLTVTDVTLFALFSGPEYIGTNMYGDRYQVFSHAFRVDAWSGDLARVTDETLDARFVAPDEFDALDDRVTRSVPETLAALAEYERGGKVILR
ncbi:NUDIX domain-containing protein [Rhizomonospora bruguierae]|uniref:NUDIX domain-containing protein n=1 Tax=Rhizomonospora bruguierae TaxID=1581705 RepID=UPI001BCAE65C|nr:NUDIX domain-containing protein [Micromonospora sp. NBRC 107566]